MNMSIATAKNTSDIFAKLNRAQSDFGVRTLAYLGFSAMYAVMYIVFIVGSFVSAKVFSDAEFLALTIMLVICFFWFFKGCSLKAPQAPILYDGQLEEVIYQLMSCKFSLSKKVDGFYVFKSNLLFRKDEVIVQETADGIKIYGLGNF